MSINDRFAVMILEDGSSIAFDTFTEQKLPRSVSVTDHPVEDGSVVSDNALVMPRSLAGTGYITPSPRASLAAGQLTGQARVHEVVKFLERAQKKQLLVGSVRMGSFKMMLVRWDHTIGNTAIVPFDLEFKEVRIAKSGRVAIPSTRPKDAQKTGMASLVEGGPQATTSEVTDEREASLLHGYLDAIGIDIGGAH